MTELCAMCARFIRSLPLLLLAAATMFTGCLSSGYRMAPANTPPPPSLNVPFEKGDASAVLNTLITYNGPGSWKRNALWDEYVITIANRGSSPVTVSSAALLDGGGTAVSPGLEPWALEDRSKTLEQRYKAAGISFVRTAGPGFLVMTAQGAAFVATGLSAATAVATVAVLALPAYYAGVIVLNHRNKRLVENEFHRRRMTFPLSLAPGEGRVASLFFPTMREPASLDITIESAGTTSTASLPLPFLKGLHVATAKAQK